ncbi:probable serine/threonine-protein kinase irlA [Dysidea avara]|uniref:probable serine/threonine-protein kinase irlA n=1 Tax=Dysidea avara TaxID=196820 RepID=UPI003325129E
MDGAASLLGEKRETSPELEAFDAFSDTMTLYVNPTVVQGKFIAAGLVDGSVVGGGLSLFMPDHAKMEIMLKQVRSNIKINGVKSFGQLVRVFNGIRTYEKLAMQLNNKYLELKQKEYHDNSKNTSSDSTKEITKITPKLSLTDAIKPTDSSTSNLPPSSPPPQAANVTTGSSSAAAAAGISHSVAPAPNLPILGQKPTMTLIQEASRFIAADWRDIGYRLDFDADGNEIDVIAEECREHPKKCCVAMLKKWIQGKAGVKPVTWQTLLQIILSEDHQAAHDSIMAILQKKQQLLDQERLKVEQQQQQQWQRQNVQQQPQQNEQQQQNDQQEPQLPQPIEQPQEEQEQNIQQQEQPPQQDARVNELESVPVGEAEEVTGN